MSYYVPIYDSDKDISGATPNNGTHKSDYKYMADSFDNKEEAITQADSIKSNPNVPKSAVVEVDDKSESIIYKNP